MRITFILPNVSMGGGTKVVAIYAQELMKRGHDVHVVSLPPPPRSVRDKLKSWLRGRGWSTAWSRTSHFDKLKLNHQILEAWRPMTDVDVPDADVVIATWWETAEWVHGLSITKGAKVYFIQGYEVFPFLPVERCKATYRLPMHKIVVAEWLKKILADEYGDHHVELVPNSVDHSQFFARVRYKQTIPTVGLLYSTGSTKRVDLALEALKIVVQKYPKLRIVCFGSERPSQANKFPDGTEFFFNPPQDEIRNLFARCDVWVTASKMEGFNLPAMEAMACRTPVVSTCAGWPAEAVKSGWNGVLLDVDVGKEEIAQAIEWVLLQPEQEWMRLSLNAFNTVAGSSWKQSASLFEQALVNARTRLAAHK